MQVLLASQHPFKQVEALQSQLQPAKASAITMRINRTKVVMSGIA